MVDDNDVLDWAIAASRSVAAVACVVDAASGRAIDPQVRLDDALVACALIGTPAMVLNALPVLLRGAVPTPGPGAPAAVNAVLAALCNERLLVVAAQKGNVTFIASMARCVVALFPRLCGDAGVPCPRTFLATMARDAGTRALMAALGADDICAFRTLMEAGCQIEPHVLAAALADRAEDDKSAWAKAGPHCPHCGGNALAVTVTPTRLSMTVCCITCMRPWRVGF